MRSSDRTGRVSGVEARPWASELDDAVGVPVRVLEPCHPFVAQLGDPLLVRLEPVCVVVLEGDAVGGQFVYCPLHVNDLPGCDRAARLTRAGGRGIDVDLTSLSALVGDPAVEDRPAVCEPEFG